MGKRITFIHSGDIHLGAPFRGLRALSPKWADRLVRAIPEAYDRVIDAALDRSVDFVLLAGDIFDTDKPSYAHYRHFLRGLERLREADIPAYIIAGNHDPYATWAGLRDELPGNVTMFGSDEPGYALFRKQGEPCAIIAARGFSNAAALVDAGAGMTRTAALNACGVAVPFVVGMLHTGLWMDPYKAPASEEGLYASGMDYWALGHIHRHFRFPQDASETKLAFCGCAQGRDIKETGDRGCLAVTLEEGMPNKLEFIACESVEWERLDVDVSSCVGTGDVLDECVKAMFSANAQTSCEEMIARIRLVGKTPLHAMLSRAGLMEDLRDELNERYPSFYCDAMVDETVLPLDKQAMRNAGLFEATLLRASDAQRADCREALAYLQKEFSNLGLALPANIEQELPDLCDRAENLALELLEGRDL